MKSLTAVCCASWLVFAGALAVGCGDDNAGSAGGEGGGGNAAGSTEPGDGGTPSSGATSNNGGSPSMGGGDGEAGDTSSVGGGSAGGGGEPGGAGAPTGEGGAGGSGETPDPNLCENFPVTVTFGPTIQLDVMGAVLCLDPCRVTSNTYSDGEGACAQADDSVGFYAASGQYPSNWARLPSDWAVKTTTAGTINQDFPYSLDMIPDDTEVTAVLSAPGDVEYTVVFTFPGDGTIIITSFTEN